MNTNSYNNYGGNLLYPQRIPTVNGREGAEAYRLAPDSNVILLDQSGKLIWIVATDSAGYRSIQGYNITPYTPPAPPDFNLLMNRMSKMEEMLSGLVSASATTGTKSDSGANTVSNGNANAANGNSPAVGGTGSNFSNPAAQF